MHKYRIVLLTSPAFNEEAKIGGLLRRTPGDIADVALVVDDGSNDGTSTA